MNRDERLRGLSSDHHHALVLARTIRRRYAGSSASDELLNEVSREFELELAPHFAIEEEILLPALEAAGECDLVRRTRQEHSMMREHVRAAAEGETARLLVFAELLDAHVRFEERTLFPLCEAKLEAATLQAVMARRPPPRRGKGSTDG